MKIVKVCFNRREILKLIGTGAISVALYPHVAWASDSSKNDLNIIPIPKRVNFKSGNPLNIGNTISLEHTISDASLFPFNKLIETLKDQNINVSGIKQRGLLKNYYLVIYNHSLIPSLNNYEKLYAQISGRPQSYFIDVQPDYLYIGAWDINGLLCGFYSLLDIIYLKSAPIEVPLVTIIDYPDFLYRSPTYLYTFHAGLTKSGVYKDKIKDYLDFLATKKVNASFWPRVTITGDWKLNEKWHYRDINNHALDRGIKLFIESHFDLNVAWRSEGVKNTRACMGTETRSGYCYGDDMLEKKSEMLRNFCKEYKPGGIIFHTIDFDPHYWKGKTGWWEQRCEVCRKKYKDDERWKADRDQIKSFYKAIKEVSPDTEIMVVLWPYHPRMLTGEWNLFPGSEEKYKDYLLKVTSEIPKDIWLATRECTPEQLDVWIKHINGQPIAWWIYPGRRNHWIYTSMAGMATWYRKDYKMAIFWNDSGIWFPYELSNMTAQQFMWTAETKGFQIYQTTKEMYETWKKENIAYNPETVIKDLVPKIAQNIYGASAPYLLNALKTNVERNDPYHPDNTGEAGWRYSRFEYDIDGETLCPVDNKIHDPVENFTTIRNEAFQMYHSMKEAIKHMPSTNIRCFVVQCIYEKSRQLYARSEGLYNWMLASQSLKKDKEKEEILNYVTKAAAYFEIEESLMVEAEKIGLPPELTPMFGYVPIYWKPMERVKHWVNKNNLNFPSRDKIDAIKRLVNI